ncbi:MAG: hypothetical protein GY856_02780, partial [bacterium]|nr:hypothetical protein [bacterium]
MTLSRRGFLGLGAAAATSLIDSRSRAAAEQSATPRAAAARGAVAISSVNGLRGVAKAYELMVKHQADPLDA